MWSDMISIGMVSVTMVSLLGCVIVIGLFVKYKNTRLIKVRDMYGKNSLACVRKCNQYFTLTNVLYNFLGFLCSQVVED